MASGSWLVDSAPLLLAFSIVCLLAGAVLAWLGLRWRRSSVRLSARLHKASTQLENLAVQDRLTGLANRAEFDFSLDEAVLRADRGGPPFSLLYADLDNLRVVNENAGHEAGDAVLREAAQRLARRWSDGSVRLGRIAADEFAVIVPGDLPLGRQAARTLEALLAEPFAVGQRSVVLTCSIGLAAYPEHGSRQRLLVNAQTAMRSVKAGGGGGFAEYDPRMGVAQREQAELLLDLRSALERNEFELFYQPKVDARSREITAAEALLRWRHPRRGVVSPAIFIPMAEHHGLIRALGDWVVAEACRQAAEWRASGLRMRMAVNVSGVQLRDEAFAARVAQQLKRHGIPPARFTCEITESVAMEDTRSAQQAFDRLRRAGVHVSIDDFGTGYSSLASLRRLPAAELKIDRAFVSDLETSEDARAIAAAIIQMAHQLDLRVVAEGIETEGQRDVLTRLGCDELQGYLFAKPMTAQALTLWAMPGADGEPAAGFRPSLFEPTAPASLG